MRLVLQCCGRRALAVLLGTSLAILLLDLLGIALVFPFLRLVTEPALLGSSAFVLRAQEATGLRDPGRFMTAVGLVLVGVYLVRFGLKVALTRIKSREVERSTLRLATRLFEGLLGARYGLFTEHPASEMIAVVNGHTIHTLICLEAATRIAGELLLLVVLGAGLVWLDPVASLLAAGSFVGLGALLYLGVVRRMSRRGELHARLNLLVYRHGFAVASSIKDIKVMGLEAVWASQFRATWAEYADNDARVKTLRAIPVDLSETLVFAGLVGACLYVLLTGRDLVQSVPALGVLAVAALRALPSFHRIASSYNEFRYYTPSVHLVAELQARLDAHRQELRPCNLPFARTLELRDVAVRYGETAALDGVSLTIQKGTAVALVGASGAGKTTLLDVIVGLRQADRGELLLDGVAVDPFGTDAVRSRAGYVPQSVSLIDESIAFNVTFERTPDPARLARALEVARLTEWVASLPAGTATTVGEGGARVSGGQRQRLGIARALYREPELLVLDEATSALDGPTERALMEDVGRLAGSKTLLVVAHRLSTVERCDVIHLLDAGRVVASGTHAALLATCDRYRELHRAQATARDVDA